MTSAALSAPAEVYQVVLTPYRLVGCVVVAQRSEGSLDPMAHEGLSGRGQPRCRSM